MLRKRRRYEILASKSTENKEYKKYFLRSNLKLQIVGLTLSTRHVELEYGKVDDK